MRIMTLLGGRVDGYLHINREKIEISQVFIEILGFEGGSKFCRREGDVRSRSTTFNFLGNDC